MNGNIAVIVQNGGFSINGLPTFFYDGMANDVFPVLGVCEAGYKFTEFPLVFASLKDDATFFVVAVECADEQVDGNVYGQIYQAVTIDDRSFLVETDADVEKMDFPQLFGERFSLASPKEGHEVEKRIACRTCGERIVCSYHDCLKCLKNGEMYLVDSVFDDLHTQGNILVLVVELSVYAGEGFHAGSQSLNVIG